VAGGGAGAAASDAGEDYMRRREFIGLLGAIGAWPQSALSETAKKRPVIGRLAFPSKDADLFVRYNGQFLSGMRELHYTEGQDFDIVYRHADFHADRLPQLAAELVQLHPDVIVVAASLDAVVAKKATDTIPIVVAALGDPVALGLIASEARPGGNVTGITPYVKGLPAKQLELARELVPGATRIGLVDDVTDPKAHPQRLEIETTGRNLAIKVVPAEVRTAADIGPAYEALAAEGVEVIVVEQSTMLVVAHKQIAEVAAAKKVPTVYGYREHVEAGGLASYGVNLDWCFKRTAYFVDKILKGANPAELPVEFPTKLELLINLKTARALGLTVPATLLARADEVIE
jgi:putative tryptophan/tyrosine transport system substrate-binding protein